MPFSYDCFTKHEACPSEPFYKEVNFNNLSMLITDNNPSTKTKDSTYHIDCNHQLINQASLWKVTPRECNEFNTCPEQYVVNEMNTLKAMQNRKLGINRPHKTVCLECVTSFNKEFTTAYKKIDTDKGHNHALKKDWMEEQFKADKETGEFYRLKRNQQPVEHHEFPIWVKNKDN